MATRARPHAEHLFSKYDFNALQEHRRQKMAEEIAQADSELIRSSDLEELAKQFADQWALEAPTLIEGALSVEAEEQQVDVTGDFRFGAYGPGPNYVSGVRVRYFVPFSGDRQMFWCAANTRNLSLRAVGLGDHELEFAYERPDQDIAATKAEFDGEVSGIRQTLGWLRSDCSAYNAALLPRAREQIVARRARLAEMAQGVQSLGVPIRGAAQTAPAGRRPAPNAQAGPPQHGSQKAEKYEIALSFAGEDRAYVEEVADRLRTSGVSVFYDGFEKANLWGKNLIDHLAEIYTNSRFVVMFISKDYVGKAWTTHERKHAQDRALFAQEEYILPARFDDTPVPGMTTTVGFQDLRHTTPCELVKLILAKLGPR